MSGLEEAEEVGPAVVVVVVVALILLEVACYLEKFALQPGGDEIYCCRLPIR